MFLRSVLFGWSRIYIYKGIKNIQCGVGEIENGNQYNRRLGDEVLSGQCGWDGFFGKGDRELFLVGFRYEEKEGVILLGEGLYLGFAVGIGVVVGEEWSDGGEGVGIRLDELMYVC